MKVELEIVRLSNNDVVTASNEDAACAQVGVLIDECDPEAE